MADNDPFSRRAREEAKRTRKRRFGIVSVVVLVLAGAAGAAVYTLRPQRSNATPTNTTVGPVGSSTTADGPKSSIAKIVENLPSRTLSHDDPLRIWVGGDSLSGELGPSLGDQLGPSGIVEVTVDFKVGSGLHDNGLRNWGKRIPEQMTKHDPEVAVFMIGANDASIVSSRTESWAPKYREKISEMMDLLGGPDHRTVYWVGPPPLKTTNLERGTSELSKLMADEAKHHEHVVFIDAYDLFDSADHHYTNRIDMPSLDKTNVLVRISDGVHFTNDGADWLAYQLAQLLDEQWLIAKQSGGKPIKVSIEANGGSVPGYKPRKYRYTTTSTRYSSSTSAAPTTTVPPQTTVAPTTAAPPPPPPSSTVGSTVATTAPPTTVGG